MSFVMYVPGLLGDKQVDRLNQTVAAGDVEMPPGTHARAVQNASRKHRLPFHLAAYQTKDLPYPTFSQMGRTVAGQYLALADELAPEQPPPLTFGSSVGAGVLLEFLHHISTRDRHQARFPHVVVFDGVYDPISTILERTEADQTARETIAAMMRAPADFQGDLAYPLPVDPGPTERNPGTFWLSPLHLRDPEAKRIMADPINQAYYGTSIGPCLPSLLILSTGRHPASPPSHAKAFARIMGSNARLEIWDREAPSEHPVILEDRLDHHLSALHMHRG